MTSTTSVPASSVHAPHVVRTKSGSRYRIDGARVDKITGQASPQRFELVDIRNNRLRYTDGQRLYISSPLVAA